MPAVIYVHGFSAAELYLDAALTRLYWVDVSQILLRTPGVLRLDAAGVRPGGTDGRSLYVGRPLTPYCGSLLALLRAQLAGQRYAVLTHSYDWRQDLYAAGQALAGRVVLTATSADPCTLVGHSAGGLVCRAAWRELAIAGKSDLVRRIVTLASPHWGTYYPVAAWSGLGDLVTQLAVLGQVAAGAVGQAMLQRLAAFSVSSIVDVMLTWPALYQLLPLRGAPDQAGDPARPRLYTGSSWSGIAGQISSQHLTDVAAVRDKWLNDARSHPPAWVMTAVSGEGVATAAELVDPDQLGQPAAIGYTLRGDGVVSRASAEADYSTLVRLTVGHSDMPITMALSGQLAALILDPRGPTSPPVTPVVDPVVHPHVLAGPPLTAMPGAAPEGRICLTTDCRC